MPRSKVRFPVGAMEFVVEQGGQISVKSGGLVNLEAGSALELGGVPVTASAAELNVLDGVTVPAAALNALLQGAAAGYKLARGVHETATAADEVTTGLATVVAVVVSLADDPGLDPLLVTADVGDQAGAPDAGKFYLKSWKATAANDVTPVAATTFAKKVNWIAIGT